MAVFIPNPSFVKDLADDSEFKEGLKQAAEPAKTIAEQVAPVLTGAYRDAFVIVEEEGEIRFGNTDWKAHFIEWGTEEQPPQAVLRRSASAAGLRIDEADR
jgi:hypothetical protein